MQKVEGCEKLLSFLPQKKFGLHRECGGAFLGESICGDEHIFLEKTHLGEMDVGIQIIGDINLLTGIWRRDGTTTKGGTYLEPYYTPYDPKSEDQLARRGIFSDGVDAWHILTDEQRAEYNKKTRGKHRSGFNAFLRQYLLSN